MKNRVLKTAYAILISTILLFAVSCGEVPLKKELLNNNLRTNLFLFFIEFFFIIIFFLFPSF